MDLAVAAMEAEATVVGLEVVAVEEAQLVVAEAAAGEAVYQAAKDRMGAAEVATVGAGAVVLRVAH